MKKVSKKELIKLLKKRNCTYKKLAQKTGYHPKYLISLTKKINNENYTIENKYTIISEEIKKEYLLSYYKSYKEFYNSIKKNYKVSYPFVTKVLNNLQCDNEILIIEKSRQKNSYFTATNNVSNQKLIKINSLKNDIKTTKNLILNILNNYGKPKNICFANYFKVIPKEIKTILDYYHINILPYKKIYKNKKVKENILPNYQKVEIKKELFYNHVARKLIAQNIVQFNNKRYLINSKKDINKKEDIILYYSEDKEDLYIVIKNKKFPVQEIKEITSVKGLSKYS